MSKKEEQITRMKGLMTYGISNTSKKTPITESVEGPDNKIYAIIREGNKFYIKSTDKGNELITESFDYIGGFMNKKNNEYSSYNQASKNLELKIRSLNESYGVNKPVELLNPDKKEKLMVEMTDAMKHSIARYRQIMNNTSKIMNESSTISMNNTGNPEAPKTTSFTPNLGVPFNNTAKATLDTDLKATANDPEKQGEPFGDNSKTEEYKDAQYVPKNSVANQKPSGGKVVKVNENNDFEETIEECDEWGSCGVPETGSVGEIGDNSPFTNSIKSNSSNEITLDEDAESFVGFADEDNNIDENEDDEDLDLDDIDIDLDSFENDEENNDEIDDIDFDEEDEDNDFDEEDNDIDFDEEDNEIESLRNEVKELRDIIDKYISNSDETNETFDNEDDTEFDENDIEFEDEDDDFDDDDNINNLSNKVVENIIKEAASKTINNGYFDVTYMPGRLSTDRDAYGIGSILSKELKNYNGNGQDNERIYEIKKLLKDILIIDYSLVEATKQQDFDPEMWETFIKAMDENIMELNRQINNISFIKNGNSKLVNLISDRAESLENILDKHINTYNNNVEHNNNFYYDDEHTFDSEYDEDDIEKDDIEDEDTFDVEIDDDPDEENELDIDMNYSDNMFDSIKPRKLNEEGNKLNVFGKHPGYRKKVMTLPQTGSDKEENYRDWNDTSVYSEEPFGNKIGKSDPYDKIINTAIETVLEGLKKKI